MIATLGMVWLALASLSHGSDLGLRAKLYKPGSQELLFSLEGFDLPERSIRHYREASGADAVIETLELKDGRAWRYIYDQRQLGDIGEARIEGQKLALSYVSQGKTKTSEVALPPNLLFGPLIRPFALTHWAALEAGETIEAVVPVLSRERILTARLEFFRDKQREKRATERVIVMKPASWFIALFLDPDYLTFSEDGARLLKISGPTLLKTKKGDGFENTPCDVIYE